MRNRAGKHLSLVLVQLGQGHGEIAEGVEIGAQFFRQTDDEIEAPVAFKDLSGHGAAE